MHWIFYIIIGAVIVWLLLTVTIVCKLFFGSLGRKKEKKTGVDTSGLIASLEPYKEEIEEGKKWFRSQNLRQVQITTFDGETLCADILETDLTPKGVILLMHGYRSSGLSDFNLVFPYYRSLGYHLIIPDQRACGRSGGKYITLGIKERYDCAAWAEFAAKEFGEEIPLILDGISMGATTVMMASALPLPKNVSGIIADCGFTSPDEVVRSVLKATHIPAIPNLAFARILARTLAKFDFKDASTIDAMKKCHYPIVFIHGKKDDFVPYEMSVRNFESCSSENKKFFSDDNAGHGMCYLERREELQQELENFLNECQTYYHERKDLR
jgi:pimeloyl-ACP methyl ester carboxylesterase